MVKGWSGRNGGIGGGSSRGWGGGKEREGGRRGRGRARAENKKQREMSYKRISLGGKGHFEAERAGSL